MILGKDTDAAGMFLGTACPERGNPDLAATPPGPFCFWCTWQAPSPTCIQGRNELHAAIDGYLDDPTGTLAADQHSHPIRAWCVSKVRDFSNVGGAIL